MTMAPASGFSVKFMLDAAQARRLVRLSDGALGRLVFYPIPAPERRPDESPRHRSRCWATVIVDGRYRRIPASSVVAVSLED